MVELNRWGWGRGGGDWMRVEGWEGLGVEEVVVGEGE